MPSIAEQGPISPTLHGALEPVVGGLLIASPFILSFVDDGPACATAIVVGLVLIVLSLTTDWRFALVRAVPSRVHALVDGLLGIVMLASPFLFGFSDHGAPTALLIVLGVLWILLSIGTRWTELRRAPSVDLPPPPTSPPVTDERP